MVASSLSLIVVAAPLMLLLEAAKEERRGLADATVEQAAAKLQTQLMDYLRAMSASEGVIFTSPATDQTGTTNGFGSIILARGPAPDYPREQITFDPAAGKVRYYPNRSTTNIFKTLIDSQPGVAVREVCFSPALKMDGTIDNALINVLIKLDDNGSSGRPASPNASSIWRTFAVQMRNN